MQTVETEHEADQTSIVRLRRGILASAIFGMGLTAETLECDQKQVTYSGIEKRFWIWRVTRVTKTAKLQDISGIHEEQVVHPFIWLLIFISAVNFFATIAKVEAWWSLKIWKLPYFWFGAKLFTGGSNDAWIFGILIVTAIWVALFFLLRRTFLVLDIGELSSIRIRVDGIPKETTSSFKAELYRRWSSNKHPVA